MNGDTPDLFADAPPPPRRPFGPGGRWWTIAAHRPFLDDLAHGLWTTLGGEGPETLADAVVLLPTRRGARDLAAAFVAAAGGRAVLLPQVRALGDLDEGEPPFEPGEAALALAPAVTPLRRRFELARLVVGRERLLGRRLDARAALQLADALGAFLDGLQLEEVDDPERVDALVTGDLGGDLARHWQVSAEVLRIATRAWPARLAELGLMDVGARRVAVLRGLARQWRDRPPQRPLVAAGSTGGAPAIADLMAAVAEAPRGAVVLPGLDTALAERAWSQVDAGHPQGALRALLDGAGVAREAVASWPAPAGATAEAARGRARERVVNEALRPAEATADWLRVIADLKAQGGADLVSEGLAGLSVSVARTEEAAAAQAAVLLREALETPGRTAALVTPDPALARRVAARMSRWGVQVDSSAGAPLADLPAGVLLALVARAAADPLDPATHLALAKHPLARWGRPASALDLARRTLERRGLRGPRPRSWTELRGRLSAGAPEPEAEALLDALRTALDHAAAPFAQGPADASLAMRALAEALEMAGADADGRLGDLWAGPGGEAAAALVAGVLDDGAVLPPVTARGWAQAVEQLLAGEMVRTGGALHPRLRILGLIEARLVRADLLVLAGLEEGVWPAPAATDPFLSRPMRRELGLPPPERRVGLAAHDFAQAACAPEVVMITAERRAGQPAVRSRWLWRLETLARGAGVKRLPERADLARWTERLDAPLEPAPPSLRLAPRPEPRPPVAARPRELAVTKVEQWVRDPYATYARYILRLKAMDRPDAPVEALARGSAIHAAFERFIDDQLHPGAEQRFAALLADELERAGLPSWRTARERALAAHLADWALRFERERRPGAELHVERKGALTFEAPGGPFTLTAKADRLERRGDIAHVLDFKTGAPPSQKQVEQGFSPQLPLTAALLRGGGFADVGSAEPGELAYVRLTGRRRLPGLVERRGEADGSSRTLADGALAGLLERVARFDDPNTPYASWAAPQFLGKHASDYDHLARVWEWNVMGGGEDEA